LLAKSGGSVHSRANMDTLFPSRAALPEPPAAAAAEPVAVVVEWSFDWGDGGDDADESSFELCFDPPSEHQRQADIMALRYELRAKSAASRALAIRQARNRAAWGLRSRRLAVARIRARRTPRSRPARRLIRQGARRATSRGDPSGRCSGTASKEGEPPEISARFGASGNGRADKRAPALSFFRQISLLMKRQRPHAGNVRPLKTKPAFPRSFATTGNEPPEETAAVQVGGRAEPSGLSFAYAFSRARMQEARCDGGSFCCTPKAEGTHATDCAG
jgi:hypothetical protein